MRFALLHVAAFGVFLVPFRGALVGWFLATYAVRLFGVTAGYHRYFSHRAYKLGRISQFLMAVLAQTSGQKGVLWWTAHHRHHHRHADRAADVHSPRQRGFWWSHAGWVLSAEYVDYDPARVADFGRFPELRWLDRHHWVPTTLFAAAVWLAGGIDTFLWGYVLSTVIVYHATFTINSIAHIWGTRRFPTPDESRNNWLLALVTFGEGWHNNHHYCMSSCRQGFRWWEIDITFLALRMLSLFGIARELRGFRRDLPTDRAA